MGGGVSSAAAVQMDEMMAYSVLLGKTITCMSFPGMYSIRDFNMVSEHKNKNDKIEKKQGGTGVEEKVASPLATSSRADGRTASSGGSGSSGSGSGSSSGSSTTSSSDGPPPLLGPELEDKFTVVVDGNVIVLDDVTKQNDEGWTPLHACCHSNTTATIGLKVLEEMVALGGDLNLKTTKGPGSFNSGFTPLHMASAYGVADIVEALLRAGADPNCRNSVDWTPLLEVCHRGFAGIVTALVRGGANLRHIPRPEASRGAHVMRGAPQSPLGEAARGGYKAICKFLLDAGSEQDQINHIGWTPLHEACYFNHLDSVQLLLVHGADATIKNAQGAMPFNMTSFQPIRDLLKEIGGEDAVKVMPTPTFSLCVNERGQMIVRVTAGKTEGDGEAKVEKSGDDGGGGTLAIGSSDINRDGRGPSGPPRRNLSPHRSDNLGSSTTKQDPRAGGAARTLHKGEMLGELPALGRSPAGDTDKALSRGDRKSGSEDNRRRQGDNVNDGTGLGGRGGRNSPAENSLRMPGGTDEGLAPARIICQLSKRVARDPVRTPYGHLFDRQMIALWLSKQGSICPLTGQPLVETELQPDEEIAAEIRAWHKNLMQQKKSASAGSHKNSKARSTATVERNERGRQGGRHEDEAIPASGDNASSCTGGRSSETHTSVGGDVTKREQSRLGELSTSVQTPVTSPARCRDQRRENSLSPPPKGRVKDDDGIVREQSKGVHDDDEHDMYDF